MCLKLLPKGLKEQLVWTGEIKIIKVCEFDISLMIHSKFVNV